MATNITATTLSAAVTGGGVGQNQVSPVAQNFVILASVTGIAAPTAGGGIQTMILVDSELMAVYAVNTTTQVVTVERGQGGTKVAAHGNGANVYYGAPQYFPQFGPPGFPSSQGRYRYFTTPSVQGTLVGLGNSTTDTAGGLYIADLVVGKLMISTGAAVLNDTTVGTDSPLVALYDYSGTLVPGAVSAAALTSGSSAFQQRAWSQVVVLPPGQYFLAYQTAGTTDKFQTIKAATWVEVVTTLVTGTTVGSPPATISVPTSFTANQGVVGYVY
jgi:hypothetical protein